MYRIFTATTILIFVVLFYNASLAAQGNTIYQKMLVKKRAERHESTGGVSPSSSRELYIYADDDDIQNSLVQIKANSGLLQNESVNIFSPSITEKSKIRKVHIVVDARKGVKINRKHLGIKEQEISFANPTIEKGANVREINVLVDAKRGGIEVR